MNQLTLDGMKNLFNDSNKKKSANPEKKSNTIVTKEEQALISKHWKIIKAADTTFESTGMVIFKNLFEIEPEAVKLFKI